MNPFEHGEGVRQKDGGETDLDPGPLRGASSTRTHRDSNATTGSIYQAVLACGTPGRLPGQDRAGHPAHHRRDQAADRAGRRPAPTWSSPRSAAPSATSRSSRSSGHPAVPPRRRQNVCYITLVPFIGPSGEQKTKPTQHSVDRAAQPGDQPDAIVCRSRGHLPDLKRKIRRNVDGVPVTGGERRGRQQPLRHPAGPCDEGLDTVVGDILSLPDVGRTSPTGSSWSLSVNRATAPTRVGIIGGVHRACPTPTCRWSKRSKHAGFHHGADADLRIQAEDVEGLLRPTSCATSTGSSSPAASAAARGFEGKVAAAGCAREHGTALPRSVPGHAGDDHRLRPQRPGAHRGELDRVRPRHAAPGDRPDGLPARRHRQGRHHAARRHIAQLEPGLPGADHLYGKEVVSERPPPPLRVQPVYPPALRRGTDFRASGTSPDGRLVEFIELEGRSGSARRPIPSS